MSIAQCWLTYFSSSWPQHENLDKNVRIFSCTCCDAPLAMQCDNISSHSLSRYQQQLAPMLVQTTAWLRLKPFIIYLKKASSRHSLSQPASYNWGSTGLTANMLFGEFGRRNSFATICWELVIDEWSSGIPSEIRHTATLQQTLNATYNQHHKNTDHSKLDWGRVRETMISPEKNPCSEHAARNAKLYGEERRGD